MPDIRFKQNTTTDYSELEVLLALKDNIFKNLKVGSFAQVVSVNTEDNTAQVILFPSYKGDIDVTISVIIPKSVLVSVDDTVVVLFLDTNFKQTLKQTIKKQKRSQLETTNVVLHSLNYGVIIASMSQGGSPGPGPTPTDMEPLTNEQIDSMFN